jgi:hypothetical protein
MPRSIGALWREQRRYSVVFRLCLPHLEECEVQRHGQESLNAVLPRSYGSCSYCGLECRNCGNKKANKKPLCGNQQG